MLKQTTSQLLMVRPVCFAFNEETAGNNAFQQRSESTTANGLQRQAVKEFDAYVALLRQNGVGVTVVDDTPKPFTPDSIFPNNCFSTHHDDTGNTLVLYPMYAANRREEREKLRPMLMRMPFDKVIDLTHWEDEGHYLEGTGSLILDRQRHRAYACRSPRTHEEVVADWARQMHYDYLLFDSVDEAGTAVYHTNVVMHIGTHTAVVCLDSIKDNGQRARLLRSLEDCGKEVVPVTLSQVHRFAGNMLEVHDSGGEPLLVMSATARQSLTPAQLDILSRHTRIVAPDIHTIETIGGGSARCMIAEIFQ
ncbi:MAG: amidinotransferase [Prevotella sp.]|nr:amidinotransferase [Prevotella sp.]